MESTSLTLNKKPTNYADPRVKAKIARILAFCDPLLVNKLPKAIPSGDLTKVFGNQANLLNARLRDKVLERHGTYKPKAWSYKYALKREGYAELAAAIGRHIPADLDIARDLFSGIATGADVPVYTEPTMGARRYHAVQNLPKVIRAELFKGWFDYDIEAAAPTLVFQFACKVYERLNPNRFGTPYPSISRLVQDRTSIRQHVVDITGLNMSIAKSVVIRLFFGAGLVPNGKQAIFRLVNGDRNVLERLKADPFLYSFRSEVSSMWKLVLMDENSRNGVMAFRTGKFIPKPSTKGKQRMGIYLRLERKVIDAIEGTLREDGVVPVLIHDGFMVQRQLDRNHIEREVLTRTGFAIRLAEARVGVQDENLKDALPEELMELVEQD